MKIRINVLAVLAVFMSLAVACVAPAAPTGTGAEPAEPASAGAAQNTLIVAIDADPVDLDPAMNRGLPLGSELIINIYDTLVAWKAPDFAELEGRLAESWTRSEDGRTYTFSLRPGVKFHDGTEFNAEAVKFSLERTKELNPFTEAYLGGIESIEVVDPLTVRITLAEPSSVFLSYLAIPQAAIVSPTAVEQLGESFNVNPVGTGAFKFVSYVPETEVVLDANEDYWRGASSVNTIVYRVIPNASTRRLEIENGTVDIVQQNGQLFSIPTEDVKALKQNPDIKVIELPSQIIRNIDFNNNKADSPVADLRVRQAITYAIDYDGLVNDLLGGTAGRVYGPLTESSWGFNPAVKENAFNRDVERAVALLEEAGYGPGDLDFTLYTFQGQSWADIGTFIQANLADVGINATVQQLEFPALRELHTTGQHDIALDGRQPWYNDPDAHIAIGYLSDLAGTALNFRMPPDAELDGLITEAQVAPDLETRKQLYYQIQELLVDRVPGVYLFNPNIIIYTRSNIDGLTVNTAPPLTEYWSVTKQAQ